jgi:hypothetical protein
LPDKKGEDYEFWNDIFVLRDKIVYSTLQIEVGLENKKNIYRNNRKEKKQLFRSNIKVSLK